MSLFNEEALARLEQIITEVFSASVEPHLAYHDFIGDSKVRSFYERLYVKRHGEDKEFLKFLNSKKSILIITGLVGTGKSTFIREKYQNSRSCVGVTVDLKQKESATLFEGDFFENLKHKVAHAVYDRMLANFRIQAAVCGTEWVDPMYDCAVFPEIAEGVKPDEDDGAIAELELASYILCRADFLRSEALNDLRAKYGHNVPLVGHKIKRERYKENLLKDNVRLALKEVFHATKYREWLRCYQLIFQQSLPLLVVIDNSDVLDTKEAGGKVYKPIVDMEGYLNHWDDAQVPGNLTLPNIKFAFAVRDENIALISNFGRRAQHGLQISLSSETTSQQIAEEQVELSTGEEFISKVVRRRLEYLSGLVSEEEDLIGLFKYFRRIFEWWFDDDQVGRKGLSQRLPQVDIISLNNRSLSQILEHISQVSFQVLQAALWANIPYEAFDERFALIGFRGRLIRAAWSMQQARRLDLHWRHEFELEIQSPYISLTRLILTRLVNEQITHKSVGIDVSLIHDSLKALFPSITIAKVQSALFALYESSVGQSELISIEQLAYISKPDEILVDSKVRVMPRGRELLDRVFIQIDFFGEMAAEIVSIPKRFGVSKILFEMSPLEAVNYVGGIFRHVISRISANYIRAWEDQICPALNGIRQENDDDLGAFELFLKSKYVLGKTFHIERCCASHIVAIKTYLGECLRANNHKLVLSPAEEDSLRAEVLNLQEYWDAEQLEVWESAREGRVHDDKYYEVLLGNGPRDNSLAKMWRLNKQYQAVEDSFRNLRRQ